MGVMRVTKGGNYDPNNISQAASLSSIFGSADVVTITYDDNGNDPTLLINNTKGVSYNFIFGSGEILSRTLAGIYVDLSDNTAGMSLTGGIYGDVLLGGSASDTLKGGAGTDRLDGGDGTDKLFGGGGDDIILASFDLGNSEIHDGGEDVDTLLIDGTAVENFGFNIDLLSGSDQYKNIYISIENVIGGDQADQIRGTGVNNLLDGRGGADVLEGRGGSDVYHVDTAGDQVIEAAGGGADTVFASVSYTLASAQEIETFSVADQTGSDAINLTGNELGQTITGNAGVNILKDGAGAGDVLGGLGGGDTYLVYSSSTTIVEASGQGTDKVAAGVDYALKADIYVEQMSTTSSGGTSAIDLAGNEIAQTITGNAGSNILDGKGGNDTLQGGAGKDFFVFSTALGAANVDTIKNFSATDDTIRLENAIFTKLTVTGPMASGWFRANTTGMAQDTNDHVIYETDTGKLFYDVDANGTARRFNLPRSPVRRQSRRRISW